MCLVFLGNSCCKVFLAIEVTPHLHVWCSLSCCSCVVLCWEKCTLLWLDSGCLLCKYKNGKHSVFDIFCSSHGISLGFGVIKNCEMWVVCTCGEFTGFYWLLDHINSKKAGCAHFIKKIKCVGLLVWCFKAIGPPSSVRSLNSEFNLSLGINVKKFRC